ncbi:MAG: indolepyruvate oxidoreductase subunit beta family protein [Kordiimonadaceae bacterium]|nr:indolepyruvate oxidoreductase subunit beta family protein [Kordiimonadaceae bacterium]MBT6036372.1 indolepyruvate oxidoreductase subunit beta family protein [Kordiimonadaceae bacterium]MBT6328444.1 indolepyruvate oxidoreductase subunit beta family protein [Kordiimonadaceae bacterium]MBT7582500.1 indolepyruvate oxidoreductase subunit beta family protein [Kordiimonadaceae bacterium]
MTKSNRISIAIAALGGQGGGVLSGWVVDLAEANGYLAQYTAIAGVAQRTGATIYAIELFPEEQIKKHGSEPVLSLMPIAGDVDICLSSELIEAGRAVNRGIVTADKTTLIASDHRVYAIGEKEQMGDGRIDSDAVRDAIKKAAKKLILFNMDEMVLKSGSVISSVLFGALAGSGALPFSREKFEETIKKSGRAVNTNLAGFDLGYQNAKGSVSVSEAPCAQEFSSKSSPLLERIENMPDEARAIVTYGLHRLVDYQDADYAELYLSRLDDFKEQMLLSDVARHLALWMGFEDIIRVADLKTRVQRSEKIASEIRVSENQIWYGHDYFHPRYAEFTDTLPASLGRMMARSSIAKSIFSPFFSKGRIIRPKTIFGYLILRSVAGLRFMRKKSLRYHTENKRIISWLDLVKKYADDNPALALEIARCPRLIKGYGETHARGINRFSAIMAYVEKNGDAKGIAEKIAELRDAALLGEKGTEFNHILEKGMTDHAQQKGEFTWAGSS